MGLKMLFRTLKIEIHQRLFVFYQGVEQVTSKKIAERLYNRIKSIQDFIDVISVTLIESNPANNPQPLTEAFYVKTFCFPII
jgi:hypothetical protein